MTGKVAFLKNLPIPIIVTTMPATNNIVVKTTTICLDDYAFIGALVLSTFGSFILKKKSPNPAVNP